jgi:hypothetical protein
MLQNCMSPTEIYIRIILYYMQSTAIEAIMVMCTFVGRDDENGP